MEALVKEAGLTPGERIRYKAFIQEPKIEVEKPTVREEEPCPFSLDFTEAL